MILLSEYHASSIRLWRVVLLRSGIWLSPSDIRCASFEANRISLWGEAEQYHCPKGNITLCEAKNITHKNAEKREFYGIVLLYYSLFFCIASFAFVKQIHRAMPIPLLKFSEKDYTHFVRGVFLYKLNLNCVTSPRNCAIAYVICYRRDHSK